MTSCAGCELELPAADVVPVPAGYDASSQCWQLYGEVVAYGYDHPKHLGRWHQTCVDAYRGQHVGPEAPQIAVAFALNGLYLVLERGFTGYEARKAHGYLASTVESWPRFTPPRSAGETTVLDIALASTPVEHARLVQGWGHCV